MINDKFLIKNWKKPNFFYQNLDKWVILIVFCIKKRPIQLPCNWRSLLTPSGCFFYGNYSLFFLITLESNLNILYVDESGDDGFSKDNLYTPGTTPSKYFIRTGLIIHDRKWQSINNKIDEFKVKHKIPYGLFIRLRL